MKKYIIIATTLAALAACSSDQDLPGNPENPANPSTQPELRLTSALGSETRAYTSTQATQLTAGQTVYAWVDDHGLGTEHVKAWTLTCQTDQSLSGTNKYYFPASGYTVDVYAVHGNFTATEGTTAWTTFNTGLTHSVETDQTVAGNLEKSDLLFARETDLARNNNAKTLHFAHELSKIEVYLVAGSGLVDTDITNATVKLLNVLPTANVTLSKSGTPDATITAGGTATTISTRMQYATDVTVNVGTTADPNMQNAYAFVEAIIVPQYFDTAYDGTGAAQQFLEVDMPSGVKLYTSLKRQFEKGKKYSYNVTVNSTELIFTSTISDWDDAGTENVQTDS